MKAQNVLQACQPARDCTTCLRHHESLGMLAMPCTVCASVKQLQIFPTFAGSIQMPRRSLRWLDDCLGQWADLGPHTFHFLCSVVVFFLLILCVHLIQDLHGKDFFPRYAEGASISVVAKNSCLVPSVWSGAYNILQQSVIVMAEPAIPAFHLWQAEELFLMGPPNP